MANGEKTTTGKVPGDDDTATAVDSDAVADPAPKAKASRDGVKHDQVNVRERHVDEAEVHAAIVEGIGDPDASILNRDPAVKEAQAHAGINTVVSPQTFMTPGFGHVGPEPLEMHDGDDVH